MYLRELLQNTVDAITARRSADPDAPAVVVIDPPEVTGDGTLQVRDTGVGLSEREVHDLLATIGRSSKRDELGMARHSASASSASGCCPDSWWPTRCAC